MDGNIADSTSPAMHTAEQPVEPITPDGLAVVEDAAIDTSPKHINPEEAPGGGDGLLLSPVSAVSEVHHNEPQLSSSFRAGSKTVSQSRGFSISHEFSNVRVRPLLSASTYCQPD